MRSSAAWPVLRPWESDGRPPLECGDSSPLFCGAFAVRRFIAAFFAVDGPSGSVMQHGQYRSAPVGRVHKKISQTVLTGLGDSLFYAPLKRPISERG
jgi:hypothetical protein